MNDSIQPTEKARAAGPALNPGRVQTFCRWLKTEGTKLPQDLTEAEIDTRWNELIGGHQS